MEIFKIELGAEVVCISTGFTGINTSNSVHLNGCNRCFVQPKCGKDGKYPDGYWIDEPSLAVVARPKKKRVIDKNRPGGFPSQVK